MTDDIEELDKQMLGRTEPEDDSAERIPIHADVPQSQALAVVTPADAHALARRLRGEPPPNECRFRCVTCGWDKTLKFEPDEIEALAGDITSYGGPCGQCESMTLVPYSAMFGAEFKPILERDKEQRHKEYKEQAEVQAEVLVKTVQKTMAQGSTLDNDGDVPESDPPPAPEDDMSTEGLKPRQG